MIKAVVFLFALIGLSCGQYLRQQQPPAASWAGRSGAAWGGPVGYANGALPGYAAQGGYRASIGPVANGGAYGGAYRGGYGAGYGGAYRGGYGAGYGGALTGVRGGYGAYGGGYGQVPAVAGYGQVARPIAVAQPQAQYYGGRYAEDESPKPYSFGFNSVDEYGTQLGRQETADGSGAVRGSYSYKDPAGQFRQVQYVADAGGFRAEVDTNEAGVVSHKPADAVYRVYQK